ATYNVTAPSTAAWNGTTYSFDYWFGSPGGPLLYSNDSTLNGAVAGGEHFRACYTPQPRGTCTTPGSPGFLGVSAVPSNAQLTVDGVPASPTPVDAPMPESPGRHWVNASAPGYFPLNASFVVTPGNTTWANLTLVAVQGTIAGTVEPTNARVTVDGTPIPVIAGGSFAVSLLPGTYTVVASVLDYYPYTNASVPVTSSNTTFLPILLVGLPGWINGTVTPASISVLTLDDQPAPVDPATGVYSLPVAPGVHWVNASAVGYLPASSGPVTMTPFGRTSVDLHLERILGTVAGLVVPSNAVVTLNGTLVPTTDGGFTVDLPPAAYSLTAAASGFDPLNLSVNVRFGETTVVVVTLNVSNGWITGSVVPTGARLEVDGQPVAVAGTGSFNVSVPPGSHHVRVSSDAFLPTDRNVSVSAGRATNLELTLDAVTTESASPSYLLPAVVLVGVAVAVVAGVLLWRRRRRPPDG
ncbi:MAG TPA: PEGA domain-containing protein, partial [Thermoplasmata archaeon]